MDDDIETSNATNCTGVLFSEHQLMILGIIQAACALVSCLGCCFIFFIIIIFKKYVYSSQRLIMYLTVAVLLLSISYIIRGAGYKYITLSPFCEAVGFLSMYSGACTLTAVTCLLIDMFNRSEILCSEPLKLEKLCIPAIFVAPALLDWIPFIDHAYRPTKAWCWIQSEDPKTCDAYVFGLTLQYTLWYGPLYVIIMMGLIMYVAIIICAQKKSKQYAEDVTDFGKWLAYKAAMKEVKLFSTTPILHFACNLATFTVQTISNTDKELRLFSAWVVVAALQALQGGFIALIVGLDPQTRKRVLEWKSYQGRHKLEESLVRSITVGDDSVITDIN